MVETVEGEWTEFLIKFNGSRQLMVGMAIRPTL